MKSGSVINIQKTLPHETQQSSTDVVQIFNFISYAERMVVYIEGPSLNLPLHVG
jgi:hypothetical protein